MSDEQASGEWLGDADPQNRCFGCGQGNPLGLRLRFRRAAPGEVEAVYEAPEHQAGAPGVVHGGIQAALLDEALGFAALAAREPGASDFDIVTAEFSLRYRRPVPTGRPLRLRGRFVRSAGHDLWMTGAIEDAEGQVLTEAQARWRRLDPR